MSKNPENRFQSAEEVDHVLTQYLAHLEQPQTQPKPKIRRAKNRRLVRWLAGVSLVVALIAASIWWSGIFNKPKNTWPEGIQPAAAWQRELDELEREIMNLETPGLEPSSGFTTDPMQQNTVDLERSIRQLEQQLYE